MFDCCSAKNITGLLVSFVYVIHHSFLTTSPYPAEVWPDQDGQNSTAEFYVKYLSSQKNYYSGVLPLWDSERASECLVHISCTRLVGSYDCHCMCML